MSQDIGMSHGMRHVALKTRMTSHETYMSESCRIMKRVWVSHVALRTHTGMSHDTYESCHTCHDSLCVSWNDMTHSRTHIMSHETYDMTHTCHDSFLCVSLVQMSHETYDMTHSMTYSCVLGIQRKRALQKRLYSAKETYNFKKPTNRSHPIRKEFNAHSYVCWHQVSRIEMCLLKKHLGSRHA